MNAKAETAASSTPRWVVAVLSLLATGFLLGLSTNLAKVAANIGLGPLAFLSWSVLGATVILFAINLVQGHRPPVTKRTSEYFFFAAIFSVAAPNLIFFAAVPQVGASFVALCIAFPPLFTYVGALALRMERFNSVRALGVALALCGAAWLALLKLTAPDAPTFWIVLAMIGPIILAMGNIYRSLRWPPGATPDVLAPGMLAAASALLLLAGLVPGFSLAVPMDRTEPMLLILVQSVAFAAQYFLFFVLQRSGGPVFLSLLGSVAAVTGVPVAILLLGEAPLQGLAIGAALIAAGIFLVARGGRKRS